MTGSANSRDVRCLGITWGNPDSVATYSGVPYYLFAELRHMGVLAGIGSMRRMTVADHLLRGGIDWRRGRRNRLWRYMPENIERLSRRFASERHAFPRHDVVLQFGVAGTPPPGVPLVAHVEIAVETAISTRCFAESYGFDGLSDATIRRAIEGERMFLEQCSIVWTNSEWTAEGLRRQRVPDEKLRARPPACGIEDPGEIAHDWDACRLLFIGMDWKRKGGELLLDAFRLVRREKPGAKLTIVGCDPNIREAGVEVLGLLRKDDAEQRSRLLRALEEATIFTMPTYWDSTGMVFMEAALYGLPLVMLAGQGRERIFPENMAVQVPDPDPEQVAGAILDLTRDPERMQAMGREGRRLVLEAYTWPVAARDIVRYLAEAVDRPRRGHERSNLTQTTHHG